MIVSGDSKNPIILRPPETKTVDSEVPQAQASTEILQPQGPESSQSNEPHPPPYTETADPEVTDFPAAMNTPSSNISEQEWNEKLRKLEGKIRKYNWTKQGDEVAIVESMRDLAASHNDPQIQAYWTRRANEFENAPESDKKALLKDIGRGLAILVAAPFAIAGAVLMGTGMLLKAGGNMLTGGKGNKLLK